MFVAKINEGIHPLYGVAFLWRCWIADETVDTTEYFYTNIQNMRNKKPNLRYVRQHEQHKEGWASIMYIKKASTHHEKGSTYVSRWFLANC